VKDARLFIGKEWPTSQARIQAVDTLTRGGEAILAPVDVSIPFNSFAEVLSATNDMPSDPSVAIFTRDIAAPCEAAARVDVGLFNMSSTSPTRAGLMPQSRGKASSFGHEGPPGQCAS